MEFSFGDTRSDFVDICPKLDIIDCNCENYSKRGVGMERRPLIQGVKSEFYNKCIIGIPTFGAVSIEFMERLIYLGRPMNFGTEIHYVKCKEVAEARNEIVEYALNTGARYVFFIDDDVLVPSGALNVLVGRLAEFTDEILKEKGKNIVYGPYFSKGQPIWPLVFTQTDEPCDQRWYGEKPHLRECLFIGMGCTLIPTRAFKEIPPPWFETPNRENPDDPYGPMIAGTEDAYFCAKIREAGWRIWAETGIRCYHFDAMSQKSYGLHPEMNIPAEFDLRTGEWKIYPPIGISKAGDDVRNFKYQQEVEQAVEVPVEKPKKKANPKKKSKKKTT